MLLLTLPCFAQYVYLMRLGKELSKKINELDYFSDALQVLNLSVYLHVLATKFQRFLQSHQSMALDKNIHLPLNHTWRMEISTFEFKQLFNFLSDPVNTNIKNKLPKTCSKLIFKVDINDRKYFQLQSRNSHPSCVI